MEFFSDLMGEIEMDTNIKVKGKVFGNSEAEGKAWNYGYSNRYKRYPPPYT